MANLSQVGCCPLRFGMVFGVTGVGSLFAVMGAAAGAAVGALTRIGARKPVAQEAALDGQAQPRLGGGRLPLAGAHAA